MSAGFGPKPSEYFGWPPTETVHAHADLACVTEFIGNGPFYRGIDVSIVKDDIRRVTA
jgi:hypothetical protein